MGNGGTFHYFSVFELVISLPHGEYGLYLWNPAGWSLLRRVDCLEKLEKPLELQRFSSRNFQVENNVNLNSSHGLLSSGYVWKWGIPPMK